MGFYIGEQVLVWRGAPLPLLPPAPAPPGWTNPGDAVAAGSRAPAARAADEPAASPVARRGVARAPAHLRQCHRGSLLERDVDFRGSPTVEGPRLGASIAPRPHRGAR